MENQFLQNQGAFAKTLSSLAGVTSNEPLLNEMEVTGKFYQQRNACRLASSPSVSFQRDVMIITFAFIQRDNYLFEMTVILGISDADIVVVEQVEMKVLCEMNMAAIINKMLVFSLLVTGTTVTIMEK